MRFLAIVCLCALAACGRDPTSPLPLRGLCAEDDVCDPSPYIVPAPQPPRVNDGCWYPILTTVVDGMIFEVKAWFKVCPIP